MDREKIAQYEKWATKNNIESIVKKLVTGYGIILLVGILAFAFLFVLMLMI